MAGVDEQSGVDFSFRREWIRRRMEALASVFGVDVLTYAVLSNHIHLILRNRPDVVAAWSDEEAAVRWLYGVDGAIHRLVSKLGLGHCFVAILHRLGAASTGGSAEVTLEIANQITPHRRLNAQRRE